MPAELQVALALISTSTVVGASSSPHTSSIFELPDDASPEAIHALGPELEQALIGS